MKQNARSGYLGGRFFSLEDDMTNQIAVWLAVFILGALMIDITFFGTEHIYFLGKKFFEFLEWLAFWR
ncbi:hypothetical protein J7426_04860 [Tropicibacter sp. R16_0]|uniref:hypothetical protein n=1 Tax=Tropicibacter sp. R16_0 TaxID=2821102 RepID=UPI001ADB2DA7|nr:hypothetical protein [Tropicibacter sp. R16_0]MBO9449575.1 hypothetical protein [Tropicibacter sp. R16_0]